MARADCFEKALKSPHFTEGMRASIEERMSRAPALGKAEAAKFKKGVLAQVKRGELTQEEGDAKIAAKTDSDLQISFGQDQITGLLNGNTRDLRRAQKADKVAKEAAPAPEVTPETPDKVTAWHGSKEDFTEIGTGAPDEDFFFSSKRDDAEVHGQAKEFDLDLGKAKRVKADLGDGTLDDPTAWLDGHDHEPIDQARKEGFDSLIVEGVDQATGEPSLTYVVFSPERVKIKTNETPTPETAPATPVEVEGQPNAPQEAEGVPQEEVTGDEGKAQVASEKQAETEAEREQAAVAETGTKRPNIKPAKAASIPGAVADAPAETRGSFEENMAAARSLPAGESEAVQGALQGMSVPEIAEAMGKSVEEIQTLLERGGRTVKGQVGPEARGLLMITEAGVTSTKNEIMEMERHNRGAPPVLREAVQKHPEVMALADDEFNKDPHVAERLVEKILGEQNPEVNQVNEAILLIEKVKIMNRRRAAEEIAGDPVSSGAQRAEAQKTLSGIETQLERLDRATAKTGRAWGQLGRFRQNLIAHDFSLVAMERSARAAAGRKLDEDERAQIKEQADELERLVPLLDKDLEAAKEKGGEAAFDKEVADMAKAADHIDPAIVRIAERIAQRVERAADEAMIRIKEKMRGGQVNLGIDPSILWDMSIVGSKYIARGVADITAWSAKMVDEFKGVFTKKELEPHLEGMYEDAKKAANDLYNDEAPKEKKAKVKKAVSAESTKETQDKISKRIKERVADDAELMELKPLVQQLALNLVRGGIRGRDALLTRVHAELKSHLPEITKSQTRDIISGYGDFKPLDTEEA